MRRTFQRKRPNQEDKPRYTKQWQYYSGVTLTNRQGSGTTTGQRRNPAAKDGSTPAGSKRHVSRAGYYFAAVVIVGSLLYCSILGNKVSVILTDGDSLHNRAYYENALTSTFNGSVFNHSKLTFDTRGFKSSSLENLPEVTDMTVRIPLVGRKVVVGLAFAPPALLMRASNHSYVLSADGVVLAEAAGIDESKLTGLQIIQEEALVKLTVGKPALTKENVTFILGVAAELQQAHVQVESLTLPLGASELNVRVSGQPYTIKFARGDSGGGAKQQAGAYLAVMHSLTGQDQPNEYVDVRLAERVFVK